MAVAPCTTETGYVSNTATITFGNGAYTPSCLKVSAGASVTFSGDFGFHPLAPSVLRGTVAGNPITATVTGSTKSVTFPNPGFYAYFCTVHGNDTGSGMAGVVWVQ